MSETDKYCGKQKPGGQDGTDVYECIKQAGHKGIHTYARQELVEQLHTVWDTEE